MHSFTPGPWKWGDTAGPNGIQVYRSDCKGFRGHVILANNVPSEADARLIAAAPDLLEALKGLLADSIAMADKLGAELGAEAILRNEGRARLAIAKAEGR